MGEIKDINIEIPEGFVPELNNGKLTLVYKGNKFYEMPKSWEDLNQHLSGEYITSDSGIEEVGELIPLITTKRNKNIIPKGLGKPILSLIQLLQLRNATWKVTDSKPAPVGVIFPIIYDLSSGFVRLGDQNCVNHPIKFSSADIASRFLSYHSDLLWEARELL